jgi:hypothetical protein
MANHPILQGFRQSPDKRRYRRCGNPGVGNYLTPSISRSQPPFFPPHPEKLAIYLANGAQTYANRLMKRSSIRSAHASLPKGIALGRYLPRLLYAPVNKPANQLSLFHAGFLTNLRQGFNLRVGQPNSGSFHGAKYAIAPYVGQRGSFYTLLVILSL